MEAMPEPVTNNMKYPGQPLFRVSLNIAFLVAFPLITINEFYKFLSELKEAKVVPEDVEIREVALENVPGLFSQILPMGPFNPGISFIIERGVQVRVQQNCISVRWEANQGSQYPGFDSLQKHLQDTWQLFEPRNRLDFVNVSLEYISAISKGTDGSQIILKELVNEKKNIENSDINLLIRRSADNYLYYFGTQPKLNDDKLDFLITNLIQGVQNSDLVDGNIPSTLKKVNELANMEFERLIPQSLMERWIKS